MRGAPVRLIGLVLSTALLGFGCGDDSVAPDGPIIDAPMPDRPPDGNMPDVPAMPDAGPGITMAAVELHGAILVGTTVTPVMQAAISISTTPSDFVPDFVSGSGVTNGCSATRVDLAAGKLPPALYNMGSVVVTQYTGTALGTQTMVTCAHTVAGYDCDFPNPTGLSKGLFLDGAAGNATHWIVPGDRLNFNVAGGAGIMGFNTRIGATAAAVDNFSAQAAAVQGPNVNPMDCSTGAGGGAVQLAGNTGGFAFDNDMLVNVNCGGQACGLVAVTMAAATTTNPTKAAGVTCTRLITAATQNCVRIPMGALTVLNYNGWNRIQTSVVHFGTGFQQGMTGGASALTLGNARGQFFIKVP